MSSITPYITEFEKVIAFLKKPEPDDFQIDADYIFVKTKDGYMGDVFCYIAHYLYKVPKEELEKGGRIAAYLALKDKLNIDAPFVEAWADCDEILEYEEFDSQEITLKDYAHALELYVINDGVMSWAWWLGKNCDRYMEDADSSPE